MNSTTPYETDENRWLAVTNCETDADGEFYYGVITTGVFCRPSCRSRLPNRKNVVYFQTPEEAQETGYRPCRRCDPTTDHTHSPTEEKIVQACRSIEQSETPLTLEHLAAEAGLSRYHFHRLFKKIVGITPKQYSASHRSHRFRNNLQKSQTITEAIYSAGYGSSSGAYSQEQDQLAMNPKDFRKGAVGITIRYGLARCTLGWIIVASTERGICAIEFADEPKTLPVKVQERFPEADLCEADSEFAALLENVIAFVDSPKYEFNIPLDIRGTAFQQKVWKVLRQIKPGETISYTDVAKRIGSPQSVRAVASACAANSLAVVIPCHRVVSKSGKMSGYRWGIERKEKLLEIERGEDTAT